MRILVLGGTVFIGRAITTELQAAGHDVAVLHRGVTEPDDLPPVHHIHVDRAELAEAAEEIGSFAPDAAIDNTALTGAAARAALDILPAGLRLCVTSSMDVYRVYGALGRGETTEPVPVDETGPLRENRYPYRGRVPSMEDYEKLDVEEAYLERGATVVRLPMVYGPHDGQRREEFVLRRVRAGRTRIPVGSGTWLATKGFVADVARGVRLALEANVPGEVFNLGEEATYPMGMWVRMILDAAGSGAELVRVPDDVIPEDLTLTGTLPQHLLIDSSKARRELGWRTTPQGEALAASVAWHLDHPPHDPDPDFSADDRALEAAG